MARFDRVAPFAVAAMLLASPASADTDRHGLHRPAARSLTVRPRVGRVGLRPAVPLGVEVVPGVVFETPFTLVAGTPDSVVRVPHYLGPDGSYESQADLVRSINGTPCGQACTRRSLERWGYAPVD